MAKVTREDLRTALLSHLAARDEFWKCALDRGWRPSGRSKRVREAFSHFDLPTEFRLTGAKPYSWSEEARNSPQWRKWVHLRSKVVTLNEGLIRIRIRRYPAQTTEDREDLLQAGRMGAAHGVDLWAPSHSTTPATYIGRWIWHHTYNEALRQTQHGLADSPATSPTYLLGETHTEDLTNLAETEDAFIFALDLKYGENAPDFQ